MTERERALEAVYALGFALDDALLYLDTHPCDEAALCYYQQTQDAYNEAREQYTACFGPLQISEVAQAETHLWTATAWPWEVEG